MAGDLTPDDAVVPKPEMVVLIPIADGVRLLYRITHEDPRGTFHARYLRDADSPDWKMLDENVAMHTMMRFFQHDDGRGCGYHSRLGKWTFDDTRECLRGHVRPDAPTLHDRVLAALREAGRPVPWMDLWVQGVRIADRVAIRNMIDEWEAQGKLRVTKDGIVWTGEDKVDHP